MEAGMQELTTEEVRGVGHAVGLDLQDPELTEVTYFSLASSPALSICCGFTSENLPIGLQIGGKPFAEQTVLDVAYAYQQATDWHERRPPI
jgi:Asp-tRNA(Asn)/Glu-tRNA(Gln) amidotransferase A subunit family amidase